MGFQQVAEPKVGKNRVHFDLASEDPAAERRRVESLGGQRLTGYEGGGFIVMADPATDLISHPLQQGPAAAL
jgi:hypothetical protein